MFALSIHLLLHPLLSIKQWCITNSIQFRTVANQLLVNPKLSKKLLRYIISYYASTIKKRNNPRNLPSHHPICYKFMSQGFTYSSFQKIYTKGHTYTYDIHIHRYVKMISKQGKEMKWRQSNSSTTDHRRRRLRHHKKFKQYCKDQVFVICNQFWHQTTHKSRETTKNQAIKGWFRLRSFSYTTSIILGFFFFFSVFFYEINTIMHFILYRYNACNAMCISTAYVWILSRKTGKKGENAWEFRHVQERFSNFWTRKITTTK